MMRANLSAVAYLAILGVVWPTVAVSAGAPEVSFQAEDGQLVISIGRQPVATYVYEDQRISRPHFAHVKTLGGIQVTRNHPPIAGADPADHADLHPGVWLAFGDLSGADDWRLKAAVRHKGFVEKPEGGEGRGSFAVRNEYLSADGSQVICEEVCRYTCLVGPSGYLLLCDSEFRSDAADFEFRSQDEMGLGVRVATPLSVKKGGVIALASGERNEAEVRGKVADWCDYSGTIEGQHVGVCVMPGPGNARPCWYHVRDYGLLVANPFQRESERPQPLAVSKGSVFRLAFGVLVHAAPAETPADLKAAYADFLAQLAAAQSSGATQAPTDDAGR